jgi:hypothetical protein
MIYRVLIDAVLFLALLVCPWWVSVIFVLAAVVYFPLYIEALFFAFIFGILYGGHTALLVIASILAATEVVKKRIRR